MTEPQPLDQYKGFNIKLPTRQQPAHVPERPSWACAACGLPWPCATARVALKSESADNPTHVAMLMWDYLEAYARDFGAGPLIGAFDRFIRWTR